MPTLRKSILTGSVGFCASSLLVFGTVAWGERWMYEHLGLPLSYLVWTVLFIGSGALVFNSLIVGPLRGARFFSLFAVAFFAYAAAWCAAYFLLRGAIGEWCGSAFGAVLMALVFGWGFQKLKQLPRLSLLLFATNATGYFLGSLLNHLLGGQGGMILWGVSFGLFFGAGIGALLHDVQR